MTYQNFNYPIVTDQQYPKELGFKKSPKIINYIKQFSATEKAIFGIFVLAAFTATILMASRINEHFMVQVPSHGGELREGMVGLPRSVNPVLAIIDTDRDISSLVYSGLLKWDGGKLGPDIAKSYKVSKDGLTYNFQLRNDVHFQDGTALTAEDVAFTIQKIQDATLKSPRRSDWVNVSVQVISPTEIEFTLKQAYSPFITNTTVGIIPKHIWNTVKDDQFIFSHYNIEPVGSGPYKISDIKTDSSGIPTDYTLSTWSGYYNKTPYIDSINFSFFADEEKALAALDNGSIDSLATVSPNEAAKLASDSAANFTVMRAPLPRIFGVFINQNQTPVLSDKVVRKALDMAVDRKAIVDKVLSGYGIPIDSPLPSSIMDGTSSTTSMTTNDTVSTSSIKDAQAFLEKNGWKKDSSGIYAKANAKKIMQPIAFDIYTADTADLKQTAEMIKDSWTEMGAEVELRVFNASDLYQNIIRTRKYDTLLFGEQIGKDNDLYAFWHSSQLKAPGLNVSMYANSKVDKLLEDIRATNDDVTRAAKYTQFNDSISADIPAIFLYSPDFIYVIPKKLKGVTLGDISTPTDRWNSIADWYLNTENVWRFFADK